MSVIKCWLTAFFKAASVPAFKYIPPIRLVYPRIHKSTSYSITMKLPFSPDLFKRNYI